MILFLWILIKTYRFSRLRSIFYKLVNLTNQTSSKLKLDSTLWVWSNQIDNWSSSQLGWIHPLLAKFKVTRQGSFKLWPNSPLFSSTLFLSITNTVCTCYIKSIGNDLLMRLFPIPLYLNIAFHLKSHIKW